MRRTLRGLMSAPTGPFSEYAPTVATIKPGFAEPPGQQSERVATSNPCHLPAHRIHFSALGATGQPSGQRRTGAFLEGSAQRNGLGRGEAEPAGALWWVIARPSALRRAGVLPTSG